MELRDRFLILPGGTFRVSKPGYDVNTATLDQMAFDARFGMIGMAIDGASLLPRPNHRHVASTLNVPFGRTFDLSPMFLFGWHPLDNPNILYPPRIDELSRSDDQQVVDAQVRRERVTFKNWIFPKRMTVRWRAMA